MKPDTKTHLRQRRSKLDKESELTPQQLRLLSQTAAELQADSMFNKSSACNDDYNPTAITTNTSPTTAPPPPPPPPTLQSRASQFQQQQQLQQSHTSCNTYPPKKNGLYTAMQKKASSSHSLEQTTKTSTTMSLRQSPLRSTNTGRFNTKRSTAARRSFSESSAEKQLPKKYTSSDSSPEQDELMMTLTAAEKRRSRKTSNNGLHQTHKYRGMQQTGTYLTEDDVAACTMFGSRSQQISDFVDIAIRIALVLVFSKLETHTAFKRVIHPEEMWMYKNPRTKDFVSPSSLILAVIFGPLGVSLIHLVLTKDMKDFNAATWAWTLCLCLNGLITSSLKITAGRPRPDFYYRCFPDGIMHLVPNATETDNMLEIFNCTGNIRDINEGRKSFPSGHSSFAFAGFGFITYYVGSKLHAFDRRGRGQTWRLFVALSPLLLAALVAVSRTCDYHHHYEDVTVGAVIGLAVSYYVYRQYYPSIFSPNSHRPYIRAIDQLKTMHPEPQPRRNRRRLISYKRLPSEECGEASLLREAHGDDESFQNDTEKRQLIRD